MIAVYQIFWVSADHLRLQAVHNHAHLYIGDSLLDMKARLDEKVDRLRSQVMQFASDGIQVRIPSVAFDFCISDSKVDFKLFTRCR